MRTSALVSVMSCGLVFLSACGDDDSTPASCSYTVTPGAASQDAALGAASASDSGLTSSQCVAICGPGIVACQEVGTATRPQIECTGYCM
jgi:hypothetical protein